jgi:hypothetical protein
MGRPPSSKYNTKNTELGLHGPVEKRIPDLLEFSKNFACFTFPRYVINYP